MGMGKIFSKLLRLIISLVIGALLLKVVIDYQDVIKTVWEQWWKQGDIRM